MPQLSLYIDDNTLRKIETIAKINETSISKLVSGILKDYFSKSWPEGFKNLFGSISDDTFVVPDEVNLNLDVKREEL